MKESFAPPFPSTEQHEQKRVVTFEDGPWRNKVEFVDAETIRLEQRLTSEEAETVQETGVYRRIQLPQLEGPFFLADETQSTAGCLPHGDACYLHEADVILVGSHLIENGELKPEGFTILAHEIGHRQSYEHVPDQTKLTYNESEILAWEESIKQFGDDPRFDRAHATEYLARLQQRVSSKKTSE